MAIISVFIRLRPCQDIKEDINRVASGASNDVQQDVGLLHKERFLLPLGEGQDEGI